MRKASTSFCALISFVLCSIAMPAFGQVPRVLDYQGRLADPGGAPVSDASYNVTFRLYEAAEGGTAVWTENQAVTTQNGLFSAVLGSVAPLDALVFDRPYYLGIDVNSAGELAPRVQLTAAPYSLNAAQLEGQGPEAFAAASHTHGGADITDGSVGTIDLADDAVDADKIADGAVGTAEIADAAIDADKIADGTVGAAEIADGSIANADVSATAAIAGTKIAPDFGAQTVVTTGSLGVGTASPATALDVQGGTTAAGQALLGAAGQGGAIRLRRGSDGAICGALGYTDATSQVLKVAECSGSGELRFHANNRPITFYQGTATGTEVARIDGSGNLGLGTGVPGDRLHLVEDTNALSGAIVENTSTGSAAQAALTLRNTANLNDSLRIGVLGTGFTTIGGFVQDGAVIAAETNLSGGLSLITRAPADLRFYTNGHTNERMRITSAGNVGIGTTSPTAPLHVNGSANISGSVTADGVVTIDAGSASEGGELRLRPATTGGGSSWSMDTIWYGTPLLRIYRQGATTKTTFLMDEDGRVSFGSMNPIEMHRIDVEGGAYCDGTSWMNASSRELKQNIEPLSELEAARTLSALQPVRFEYRATPEETSLGFIAEDVPELVAAADRKGLNAMDLVAVLTRVAQLQKRQLDEQAHQLEAQKQQLHAQRQQLDAQERRLARLEQQLAGKPAAPVKP